MARKPPVAVELELRVTGYVIHLQRCPETHTISLGEAALVLGLYLLSPAGLLGAVLVGAAGALVLVRRQRAAKLVFNLAHLTITTGIALIVFRSVSGLGTRSGSRAGPA